MDLISKVKRKLGFYSPQKFAIICHQRSGSNMLTSVMQSHKEINFYGQVFKSDESWQQQLRDKKVPPFKGQLFDDQIETRERFDRLRDHPEEREERNVLSFIDDYLSIRKWDGNGKMIGLKFHGGTLYDEEIEETFLDRGYKIILLHRENLLAAAISWYRARTLNQWAEKNADKVKKIDQPLDIDQLEWFIKKTQNDLNIWNNLLEDHDHLHLTYETSRRCVSILPVGVWV